MKIPGLPVRPEDVNLKNAEALLDIAIANNDSAAIIAAAQALQKAKEATIRSRVESCGPSLPQASRR